MTDLYFLNNVFHFVFLLIRMMTLANIMVICIYYLLNISFI